MSVRRLCLALAVTGALVIPTASVHANGLNLSWDACGAAGVANKQFACNTNTGEERLVLSGVFPMSGPDPQLRYRADLDFTSGSATLPSWWSMGDTSPCRAGALSMIVLPGGADLGTCQWTDPSVSNYVFSWSTTGDSPLRRRLTIVAEPFLGIGVVDRQDDLETWVGTLLISHVKSAGVSACGGCTTPVCIVFNSLQVFQSWPPHALLTDVNTPLQRNFVTWQGGTSGMAICPAATPARNSTWGSLKTLYH